MKLKDAALNIATLGYHSYRQSLQLEQELKSLRDNRVTGATYNSGLGVVKVHTLGEVDPTRIFKKQNVDILRGYAEYSVWVRAALDIYRNVVGKAKWQVNPLNPEREADRGTQEEIENLLDTPNRFGIPYTEIKSRWIEDYLVLGHGGFVMRLANDLTPFELLPFNAANLGFYPAWDGSPTTPRYALTEVAQEESAKDLLDMQALVMVNRPRNYDYLGLSHVEVLDRAIRALLEGDDMLFNQVLSGNPNGILYLGQGANQQQVDEARQQISAVKRAFMIMGNIGKPEFIPFNATPDQLKILDTQTWFVRQVCSVFQIPTAMLQLAVDTSRANTEAMLAQSQQGLLSLMEDIRDAENAQLVARWGIAKVHNCYLDYPIMNARDEAQQADISKARLEANITSINEERKENGLDELELPIANEVLVQTQQGPVPLSVLNATFFGQPQIDNTLPQLPPGKALTGRRR